VNRVGIIAAMRGELMPLVREWPRTDHVFVTEQGPRQYFAACEGMGAAAATRSFAALRTAAGELDTVISYGWAGALSCGVKPPGVYTVAEVIDAKTGERFPTDIRHQGPAAPLRLVTLDHVALKDEKRGLAERYKAVMVDMEAATVGRLARAHGLRFLCLRGISDGYADDLPDLNRFITPDGQLRTAALAVHATLRPGSWGPLLELGRHSREAAQGLAQALPALLQQATLVF
jgi:adenosylhomocysteine nucleosidase